MPGTMSGRSTDTIAQNAGMTALLPFAVALALTSSPSGARSQAAWSPGLSHKERHAAALAQVTRGGVSSCQLIATP